MNTTTNPSFDIKQRLWNTRYGVLTATPSNEQVAESLRSCGEWIEQEINLLSGLINEGDTVLQFGAEMGAHVLWFSQAVGASGQVYVAEPSRLAFQQLCANVALNELTNVFAHSVWLGRESRTLPISALSPAIAGKADERVRCGTVDELSLDALTLLKINQPGTLAPILQGASETLRRHRPLIHVRLGDGRSAIEEIRALKELGYRCWSHLPYLHNPENYKGNSENMFPGQVFQNIVAAPVENRVEFERLREI